MNKKILQEAVDAYNKMHAMVNAMGNYAKENGANIDPIVLNRQLDVIIQYSFLQIAIIDGALTKDELGFIVCINKFGDLCDFLNQNHVNITWDAIEVFSLEEYAKFLAALQDPMIDLSKTLINVFSILDAAVPDKDLLKEFVDFANALFTALLVADGKIHDSEKRNVDNTLLYAVLDVICDTREKYIKESQAYDNEHKNAQNKQSLKDFYSKKKLNSNSSYKVNYLDKELATIYIETDKGSGSGFVISEDGVAFTCNHVVEGSKEIYVRLTDKNDNKEVVKADIIYLDKKNDFALIKLDVDKPTYFFELETDYSSIKTGDDVALFGFPFGSQLNDNSMEIEPSLTKGYIASKNKIDGAKCFYLDIRSCPGNSGGPAFALKNNKVIGYLCGSYGNERADLIFVRPFEEFLKIIED